MPLAPQVTSAPLPPASQLHAVFTPGDFLDSYTVPATATPRQAGEIVVAFPSWVRRLLQLRTLLVTPFGLSTQGPEATDKLGLFPVLADLEQELIAGFDDKHLNFQVSLFAEGGQVTLSTWVKPHNFGGRAYLTAILPFHKMVVKNALRRVARASRARTEQAAQPV
ncbi:MAG: DUF2867 domain-containing protein [Pseudomonadota bacterium]